MKTPFIGALLSALLFGCASPEFNENVAYNEAISTQINEQTQYTKPAKVTYIKKPPVSLQPVTEVYHRDWLYDAVTVNVSGRPLSVVLEEIMYGTQVPIYFGEDVKPNKAVTLNFSNKRENVLNLLSRDTGYGIEFKNDRLEVTRTITRVFTLNIPTGTVSGQLGSQGSTSGGDSVRVEGQYLNVEFDEVKVTDEVAATIKEVLGGEKAIDSTVTVSPNTTTLIVKTTPDKMQEVERIIDHYQAELSKQVLLDIQVIEFRSNLGTERGIDWNIVKDTGDGLLQFFVPGTTTVSQGAGYGLAFTGSGKWDGTSSFIKVLEKQGSVSTQTPVTAMVLNNQPAKITQQIVEPYVDEINSESSEGVVSGGFTRAKESEGVDLMVSAKVQSDDVWLRLSGQLQKIVARENREIFANQANFLTVQKSEINFVNKLRYGQTFVIASVKQTSRTAEQTKSFWTSLFGGTGSKNDTVETLVLLTPRKAQ
ncbi:type II secretion system protein GspD [Vibrio vulnificus]|uniref:type II secretion system protein GspD n=1 Tax=Vibrio vulnificus TaxID=672 RepID=UPI001029B54D|nr:hypothetical protein [Vibrio vulnificus]EIA0806461.1 hypothetical protein [Vibrio vulnificus]EJN6713231.1 hypothetical protein [Vibrio vulnificus]RZP95280.1 hypothetical protein D8T54_13955 [Vibrio vulnificus]RZR37451.1 hypothetical protein D8T58_24230 [Vibrio vulnificus]